MVTTRGAVGWIGNVIVFKNGNGGYTLIMWNDSTRQLEVNP